MPFDCSMPCVSAAFITNRGRVRFTPYTDNSLLIVAQATYLQHPVADFGRKEQALSHSRRQCCVRESRVQPK